MIPETSAGSNHTGASETWMPQVSCPSGPAAKATPGAPAANPKAVRANISRRVNPFAAVPGFPISLNLSLIGHPLCSDGIAGTQGHTACAWLLTNSSCPDLIHGCPVPVFNSIGAPIEPD